MSNNENLHRKSNSLSMSMGTPEIKKKLGDKYYENAKVGSCSHVLIKNGQALAITFKARQIKQLYNSLEKSPKSTYK